MDVPQLLSANPERLRATVACAEALGVPRGSGMFRPALNAVKCVGEEKVAAKMEHLKNTFRWSEAEVRLAVSKAPMVLTKSKETLERRSEFLLSEVGLEPAYIAGRPVILCLSLEGRLRPRYYALKFLKANGLLDGDWSYATIFKSTDQDFMEKFICPHKEAVPYLAEDYAAACRGEVPTNFKLHERRTGCENW
jgi:mTERF domain-containing protein